MQYNWNHYFLAILLPVFIGDVHLVSGGWIPSRRSIHARRRDASRHGVEVYGFGFLEQYVCPRNVDEVQAGSRIRSREEMTVTIRKDQLQTVLQQIRILEMQIVALIETEFSAVESELMGAASPGAQDESSPNQAVVVTVTSDIWALVVGNGSPATISEESEPENPGATSEIFLESTTPSPTSISPESLSAAVESALQVSIPSPAALPSTPTTPSEDDDSPTITGTITSTTTITRFDPIITGTIVTITATSTPGDTNPDVDASGAAAGGAVGYSEGGTSTADVPASNTANVGSPSTTEAADSSPAPANVAASSTIAMESNSQDGVVNDPGAPSLTIEPFLPIISSSTGQESSAGGIFLEAPATSSSQYAASLPAAQPSRASPSAALESIATSVASAVGTGTSSSGAIGSTSYVFNAQSSQNVAVYFGQTPVTSLDSLAQQCADASIDIVILSFVISQLDGGIYPSINFGAACGGQTAAMESQAPGLLSCPQLATVIETCQSTYGKKIFLSIGGATSQIAFSSATQASNFADVLWNLFGPTGNIDIDLRPFGNVSIDGFDVDNEDDLPSNYGTLASTLRSYFSNTSQKTYYLSSAPQCPFPDASNPLTMLLLCDFVWVQFYNNPPCEIGSTGFVASVQQWSTALEKSTLAVQPRLYVGAPAFSAAGSTAYANIGNAEGIEKVAVEVKGLGLSNFGGMMFWDGSEGLVNVEGGKDIIDWAKEGLA